MCVLQCNTPCNKAHDGAEAGVPRRAAELRKAEAVHGELHKEREDRWAAGQPRDATYNGTSTLIVTHCSVYLGSFMLCQAIEEFLPMVS